MNWKKLLYWVPGVGLATHIIKEYKTRKGKRPMYDLKETSDRRALGVYAIETGYLAFAILWKVYVGNGLATGNWPPFYTNSKDKKEIKYEESKKENKLEKEVAPTFQRFGE